MKRQITLTEDGSHTLYLSEMDEHYHSVHGAIQESKHVFIESGFNLCKKKTVNVFEVGFGTGLNALLTMLEAAKNNIEVNYFSIEKYPLSAQEYTILNYADLLNVNKDLFESIHNCGWNSPVAITNDFMLNKIENDFSFEKFENIPFFDVVYFDAFAPNKQPDLWNDTIYSKIFSHCELEAIFVTYCAKGIVRRGLQSAGFAVERIPGPPGKKEMLRAFKY